MRILLAEDNTGDIDLVREALRKTDEVELTIARTGEAAFKYLRSETFDLVILDLNLPRANGHAVLRECAFPGERPPFVVFSSSTTNTDRELALVLGAREYVVKPSELDEYVYAVQEIVERWSTSTG